MSWEQLHSGSQTLPGTQLKATNPQRNKHSGQVTDEGHYVDCVHTSGGTIIFPLSIIYHLEKKIYPGPLTFSLHAEKYH